MNDEILKRLQSHEKELGILAAHEHNNQGHWMIDPTTTSGDLIVLYGTDTTNYAASSLGAVATASTEYSPFHIAVAAIDSDDATFWASYAESPVGAWIYVDLGFPITIGRFRVLQDVGQYTFKIQYSSDHLAWSDCYTTLTLDAEQTGTFSAATAQYWRFLCLTSLTTAWNIYSIELYSPAGVHTLVPLHAVANVGYVLGIGADGFPAYLPAATPAAHNQAATTVTVADSADYFTGAEVEAILAEIGLGWAKLARANTFTPAQTFTGGVISGDEIAGPKAGLTAEGGLFVSLVAGENLTRGWAVMASTATDGRVVRNVIDGDMPLGVVYADATSGNAVKIVTNGIAYVLPDAAITAARGNVIYSSSTAAGLVQQASSVPLAAIHFREVGHWIDTGSGNGAITRAIVHFN